MPSSDAPLVRADEAPWVQTISTLTPSNVNCKDRDNSKTNGHLNDLWYKKNGQTKLQRQQQSITVINL